MSKICPIECRKGAIAILKKLRDADFETYFAGGCVRDRILSSAPLEYDIATSARPEDIKHLFPKSRSVGEAFGVMLVRSHGNMYDVATFRSDGPYTDKRHPDKIEFCDAEHDAFRRDFTINGMFEDPINEKIIDYVEGNKDIEERLIRAIGNPHERIAEDRLRMLRAIRFAARYEFSIESDTGNAIRECSHELAGISRERIGEEIKKMLIHESRGVAAWEIQYLGLDCVIFGEESCMNAPSRLGRLAREANYSTSLAAWILDRHTSTADLLGIASHWRTHLLLSNRVYDDLCETLQLHERLYTWDTLGIAQQKRLAASPQFLCALEIVHCEDRSVFVNIKRELSLLEQSGIAPERLINGNDLLEAGVLPSAILGDVLEAVYDAQLEGSVQSKKEALSLGLAVYRDFLAS